MRETTKQQEKEGFLSGSSNIPPICVCRREAQESFSYLWKLPQEAFPQNKAVGKSRGVDAAIKHKEGNIMCKYTSIWMKQRVNFLNCFPCPPAQAWLFSQTLENLEHKHT